MKQIAISTDNKLFGQIYNQILTTVLDGKNNLKSTALSENNLLSTIPPKNILRSTAPSENNFQLIYPYLDWWWPTAPSGQIAQAALNLVNSIPQWSTIGQYDPSGSTLLNLYQQVLKHVDPMIPADIQQSARDAHDMLIAAQKQYSDDLASRNHAWVLAGADLPQGVPAPEWTEWELSSGWKETLAKDNAAIAKAQEIYAQALGQESLELTNAIQASTPPATINELKNGWTTVDPGDGRLIPAPMFSLSTPSGQDWVNQLSKGGGNSFTIEIDQSKGSYDFSKSWAGGNASYDLSFWEINVNGSWQKWDIDQSDASVTAKIELTTTLVTVQPGVWFNGGYMKTLKGQGNFFSPWTPTGGSSPIFGEGGLLPLQIVGFVAGYQPSYEIKMSSSTYKQNYEKYEASSGIRIGPFRFGGNGGHESNTIKKDSSSTTFKGKSTATYPFIMGVLTAQPGLS